MGMFDSFFVELDGGIEEIQSKRFDCCLGQYFLGDFVVGCDNPNVTYFDTIKYKDGKRTHIDDGDRKITVFLTIINSIFVEYKVVEDDLSNDNIRQICESMTESWKNAAKFQLFLINTLRNKQYKIANLQTKINRINYLIESAKKLKSAEFVRVFFVPKEVEKLSSGEDPLDVISWILNEEVNINFDPIKHSPIEQNVMEMYQI